MRLTEVANTKKVFVFKSHLRFHHEMPWTVWYFPTNQTERVIKQYKSWRAAMDFADFMAHGGPLRDERSLRGER
jgi:hypothetical protein